MTVCLKCGGTGIRVNRKKCDCGAELQTKETLTLEEVYVPELYRGDWEKVGGEEILIGAKDGYGLKELINDIITKSPNFPSMFVDLSESEIGAYEVYYSIIEGRIKSGEPLEPLIKGLMANSTVEKRFQETAHFTQEGIKGFNNCIISDFPIEKYPTLKEWVKIRAYNGNKKLSLYPLNMYRVRVVTP